MEVASTWNRKDLIWSGRPLERRGEAGWPRKTVGKALGCYLAGKESQAVTNLCFAGCLEEEGGSVTLFRV